MTYDGRAIQRVTKLTTKKVVYRETIITLINVYIFNGDPGALPDQLILGIFN